MDTITSGGMIRSESMHVGPTSSPGDKMSNMRKTPYLIIALLLLIPSLYGIGSATSDNRPAGPVYSMVNPTGGPIPLLRTYWGDLTISELEMHVPAQISDLSSGYWMVQFDGPIRQGWRTEIEGLGTRVISYFPDFAYIIHIGSTDIHTIMEVDHVLGVVPYLSGLKVRPDLYPILEDGQARTKEFGTPMLIIDLLEEEPTVEGRLKELFPQVMRVSSTRFLVGPEPTDASCLLRISSIEWIEPDHPVILFNNVSKEIIGVSSVVQDLNLFGSGQTVAIADTGLDTGIDDHGVNGDISADFDNRVRFANWAGTSADDTHSHGTHVAGSVAGGGALSNGRIRGMAPQAEVFFQGIATDSNALSIPTNTSQLFDQAYQNGARVHTNSWGSSVYGQYTSRSWDVDWFMYTHPDMVILYSAGNSGEDWYPENGKIDNDSIGAPATAMNCITVGASENDRTTGGYSALSWSIFNGWKWTGSDYVYQSRYPIDPIKSDLTSNDTDGLAAFSSRGPTDDLRIKPDVVAPGANILSARSTKTSSTGWGTFSGNSNYIFMGGTSMSTPITAGGVALIREYFNVTLGMERPSGALLKAALINGAIDMTPGQYGAASSTTKEVLSRPDNAQGWGRINISESVGPKNGNMAFMDVQKGISTGEDFSTNFKVSSSSKELRLTLAWSDHPGTISASKHLVNDLDLVIKTPGGIVHKGNDFTAPYDDHRDDINNVEGIRIGTPSAGIYTLTVKGHNVPMGEQRFAIVGSGDMSNFSGVLKLDRSYYSTDGDRIGIELLDQDLLGTGSVMVNVSSNSYKKGKMLTLKEDSVTGVFSGEIFTINITSSAQDMIQVSHNDTITVTYQDKDPSSVFMFNATAKRPERVFLRFRPEYPLTYSTYEMLLLEGKGDPHISAWWKFDGTSMGWRELRDDGNKTFGDDRKDDGKYSDIWSIPENTNGSYRLDLRIDDHFLGTRYYSQFNMSFDPSIPRFPKNLTFIVPKGGNSIDLKWDPTNETDISIYRVFVNSSMGALDERSVIWELVAEVQSAFTNLSVMDLTDGTEYQLRVSAVDDKGKESSMSVGIRATPLDTEPPEVILLTTPRTIVGTITFRFTGSIDLERVEIEHYNDSNGNGIKDDEGWLPAVNGTPQGTSWDTTTANGGPGDVDSMFIRFRGFDEVPNISPWIEAEGFRIDNTGPSSVELIEPPDRVTNLPDRPLLGKAEKDGYVMIYLNSIQTANQTCNTLGVFQFDLNLTEGYNILLLSAYDEHGAGPTNRSYVFTLDTQSPSIYIDVGQEIQVIREIKREAYDFVSASFDNGIDDNFTFIDNITWTVSPPGEYPEMFYGSDELQYVFDLLGMFNITLSIKDPAGNTNSTWLRISIVDTTTPIVKIDGPSSVDEKTSRTFNINVTDNDPSWFIRYGARIDWNLSGPEVQISNDTQPTITISFPLPGTYLLDLWVIDGGGNIGTSNMIIIARDRTAPKGTINGPSEVILGVPATYSCNVTDNDVDFPAGATFNWNLTFIDAPPEEIWSRIFNGVGFLFNFTEPGFYTLILTVIDASGNELILPLNIEAIGDLIFPTVIAHFPEENVSHQFPQDLRVSVTFSEKMSLSSFSGQAIKVSDDQQTTVNFTYELLDGTLLNVIPEGLDFGRTYTFTVGAGVTDLWGNRVGSEFSVSYRIRNYFELVFPDGVFPSSVDDNFTGNETGIYRIMLKFTNPIQVQTLIGSVTIISYKPIMVNGRERIEKQQVSDYSILAGNDSYSAIVIVQLDMGLKYEISISKDIRDIYDYKLDWEQKWFFKTYLPPDNKEEEPDDDDDNGIPDWMKDPTTWLIAAVIIVLLVIMLIVLMVVRRSSRKKKLEKMWNETSEEGPRRRRSGPEPIAEASTDTAMDIGPPEEAPVSGDLREPQITTTSYEDLYGDVPIAPEMEERKVERPPIYDIPDNGPDYIPPPPSIDWDEDSENEDEDWGEEGSDEEESWDK